MGQKKIKGVDIIDNSIQYAQLQQATTGKLLGRATAGTGNLEEITLGTGLSFTGTTLNAAGGGSSKWTDVGTGNIYRNSKVHIGATSDPTVTLQVYGDRKLTTPELPNGTVIDSTVGSISGFNNITLFEHKVSGAATWKFIDGQTAMSFNPGNYYVDIPYLNVSTQGSIAGNLKVASISGVVWGTNKIYMDAGGWGIIYENSGMDSLVAGTAHRFTTAAAMVPAASLIATFEHDDVVKASIAKNGEMTIGAPTADANVMLNIKQKNDNFFDGIKVTNTSGTVSTKYGGNGIEAANGLDIVANNTGFYFKTLGATPMGFSINGTYRAYFDGSGKLAIGDAFYDPTARLDIQGSNTSQSGLRLRSGTDPTSPNDGDIWFDGTNLKMRIGGVTKTFTMT